MAWSTEILRKLLRCWENRAADHVRLESDGEFRAELQSMLDELGHKPKSETGKRAEGAA